jgi:8-oxo-dGTP diphosphatase
VIRRNGRILIGQRRKQSRHGLKWEFPGGKVERGETPQVALARELREELAIEAEVGAEITRFEHRYPQRSPILLIFFGVDTFVGEPRNLVFEQILWEEPARLSAYEFLEADVEFVRWLSGTRSSGPRDPSRPE